ncbi:hypothetical protein [Streptomyces armeniacus]|uniref:hypothetical protein n=1 Tax=Streptomyces armeniacus TaxID=83291 RepID=UPI001AD7FC82|nr:hypothetical protein [Streptomyces armeniacus]
MASLIARIRRRRRRPSAAAPARTRCPGRAQEEIAADLPDDDLGDDLSESLDLYELGSKPRCEEAEYLELMQDAIERIAYER